MYLQQRFLRSMNDIRSGDTIVRIDNTVGGTQLVLATFRY